MVAEPASGDESDLGVDLFDGGVGELVGDRRLDHSALLGDPAGDLDERLEPAASCPFQPCLEQREGMVGGDAVDLAQLLAEQVGAVQPLVELLDAGELELLALGEVLGVLPEREPGAFELARELRLALAAGLVPHLATDLVQRVGGGLDDVKWVQADDRVRAALGHGAGDPVGVVAGHQRYLRAAFLAQGVEELLGRFAVPAGVRPHQLPVSWSTTTVRYL